MRAPDEKGIRVSFSRDFLVLLLAAGVLALSAVYFMRLRLRLGLIAWLMTIAFVPVWFGVSLVAYFPPAAFLGIALAVALAARPPRHLGFADLVVVFFFVSCLAPALTGGASLSTLFGAIFIWFTAYAIGRLAPEHIPLPWISGAVTVIFFVVAVAALVEFFADWHPFSSWGPDNAAYAQWGPIQIRSGLARAEGAFGHSIALGSSLALALPLAMNAPLRPSFRLAAAVVILGAAAATLSRASLVAAGLAVFLSLVFLRSRAVGKIRIGAIALITFGALVLVPRLLTVFTVAGDEAAGSAFYRISLAELLRELNLVGLSPAAFRSATGQLYFAGFRSIDSQLVFTGLTYGAVALLFGVLLLAMAAGTTLAGRATAPTVAIVAQIPVLATVALITQYSTMFWFVVGLAVASQSAQSFESGLIMTDPADLDDRPPEVRATDYRRLFHLQDGKKTRTMQHVSDRDPDHADRRHPGVGRDLGSRPARIATRNAR